MLLVVVTAIACDRNHDGVLDETYETERVDIVTYTGADSQNHASFTLDGRDDEPAVRLMSTVAPLEKVKLNTRILLTYAINHKSPDGASWDIDAIGYSRIISDSIRANTNPIDTYSMHPLRLQSAWRTGEFINIHGQVEVISRTRQLYMMIDRTTRGNDTVHAYLVHDLMGTPQDSIFYWRDFYLSVNVGVLKSPADPCRTLRLHLNDAAHPAIDHRDFNLK